MIPIHAELAIAPLAWSRSRTNKHHRGVVFYTPKRQRKWQDDVALLLRSFMPAKPIDEAVHLSVVFMVKRPVSVPVGSLFRTRPDLDNYLKNLLDAMKPYWKDDSVVVSLDARKCYHETASGISLILRSAP